MTDMTPDPALVDDGCCHKTRLRDAPCPIGRRCPYVATDHTHLMAALDAYLDSPVLSVPTGELWERVVDAVRDANPALGVAESISVAWAHIRQRRMERDAMVGL